MAELPLSFVACRCGHLNPIHAVECESCGAPHPREVDPITPFDALRRGEPVVCARCGDEDGPWAITDGRFICEGCVAA